MTKKKRSVLLSVLTLVLCLALVAGGTYALFSDGVTLKNHLQAGTLDITLTRTNLVTKSLHDKTGFLVGTENPEDIDFSNPTDRNVFDITDDTLIVPGCWYSAEMQIANNSDVAFGYWLEIVFDDTANLALADQLNVKVTTAEGVTEAKLSESAGLIGSESDPIGILAKTGSRLFTIRVEFLELEDSVNNAAKSQALDFDVIVHAVQAIEAPAVIPTV